MSLLEYQGVFAAIVLPGALLVAWLVAQGDRAKEMLDREKAEARLRSEVSMIAIDSTETPTQPKPR